MAIYGFGKSAGPTGCQPRRWLPIYFRRCGIMVIFEIKYEFTAYAKGGGAPKYILNYWHPKCVYIANTQIPGSQFRTVTPSMVRKARIYLVIRYYPFFFDRSFKLQRHPGNNTFPDYRVRGERKLQVNDESVSRKHIRRSLRKLRNTRRNARRRRADS